MGEMMRKFSKRDIVLIVLAFLVIAWAIYFYIANRGGLADDIPEVTNVEGRLITGFPRELVFEDDIVPITSSRMAYSDQNFWSATYISEKSAKDIFNLYKGILEFLGWEITNFSADKFIFAKKGGMQVSLNIEDRSTRRNVALSVLER